VRKLPNIKALALSIGGIVLLSATGAYFLSGSNGDSAASLKKLSSELKDEGKIQAQLVDKQAKLADSAAKLEHLEAGVPRSAYVPSLLAELETLGKQQGLVVTGVKPRFVEEKKRAAAAASGSTEPEGDKPKKKEEKRKPYQELIIEVKAAGNYSSVYKFISALEAFPKILGVTAVDITPKTIVSRDRSATATMVLETTLDLRAYVFNEKVDKNDDKSKTDGAKTAQAGGNRNDQAAG
jgi:Tfp pilus assembly protein PilO